MRTIVLAASDCLQTIGILFFIVGAQQPLNYMLYFVLAAGFLFALRHKIEEITETW